MSIELTTRPRAAPLETAHVVPIATHDVFRRFWTPACEALQLRWVPLFETGIPLDRADLAGLLGELEAVKAWAAQHPQTGEVIGARLDGLISALRALEGGSDDVDIYVG